MAIRTDTFDIGALRLLPGEGRQFELGLAIEPLDLGGHTYTVSPQADDAPAYQITAQLGVSRMSGQGYALNLGFSAALHGPCMRCLEPADPEFSVKAREISQPDLDDAEHGVELVSPYVTEQVLDVNAWARDALVLALPSALLCQPDCLGLCPKCGTDLNAAGPEHVHEPEPDPRWAALSGLTFDGPEVTDVAEVAESEVAAGTPAVPEDQDAPRGSEPEAEVTAGEG